MVPHLGLPKSGDQIVDTPKKQKALPGPRGLQTGSYAIKLPERWWWIKPRHIWGRIICPPPPPRPFYCPPGSHPQSTLHLGPGGRLQFGVSLRKALSSVRRLVHLVAAIFVARSGEGHRLGFPFGPLRFNSGTHHQKCSCDTSVGHELMLKWLGPHRAVLE